MFLKEKYVGKWISVAGPFGGAAVGIRLFVLVLYVFLLFIFLEVF